MCLKKGACKPLTKGEVASLCVHHPARASPLLLVQRIAR
nr:MAG TPA: hypothetical protein [Caudoviricetes sp.]